MAPKNRSEDGIAGMTSRERLLAAAAGRRCDRVPVSPFGFGRLDPSGQWAQRLVGECDCFLTVSVCRGIFQGQNAVQETRTEGDYTHVTTHTPQGDLTRVIKRTEQARHTVTFPCRRPRDLEKLLSIEWALPPMDGDAFLNACATYGEEALVLAEWPDAVCMPAEWLSPVDFCLLWADEPDLMRAAVAEAARRLQVAASAAAANGVDGFRIIGAEYATTQLGPAAFRELVVEHDRELVAQMHADGAVVYYHMHGPVMAYLDDVARIDVDFLDPIEMPPYGDADLSRAAEVIDGRFCVVGTFDDMEMLEKWPLDRVVGEAAKRLAEFGTRSICLGGSASGTYTERAAAAFCAMAKMARDG